MFSVRPHIQNIIESKLILVAISIYLINTVVIPLLNLSIIIDTIAVVYVQGSKLVLVIVLLQQPQGWVMVCFHLVIAILVIYCNSVHLLFNFNFQTNGKLIHQN